MTKRMACIVLLLCVLCATVITASAQSFTSLFSFDVTDGALPYSPLLQGPNGNFYGVAYNGGSDQCEFGCGSVFEITPAGDLTTIYSFCSQTGCADGADPVGLVFGPGGNLYGTTFAGGTSTLGTVYKLSLTGQLTTLHTFCTGNCTDGANPENSLAVGTDGNLYGTSSPASPAQKGGFVFKITPAGVLTTIYNFCSLPNCADGDYPSALVLGRDGNFYGTTELNNARGTFGDIFRITPEGKLTVLHRFCSEPNCADGANPNGGLVQAPNGNFYGSTVHGGANETSCLQGCGTLFEITPAGKLTTLYSFCSLSDCGDGELPGAPPVFDAKGNLYGTTVYGGPYPQQCNGNGCGTAFELTPAGQFTVLYNFCSQDECSDGATPSIELTLATNGNLYGTTVNGGENISVCNESGSIGCGTIFSLSPVAKPFVEPLPAFGIVGAEIGILGNRLTGATSVTFNGTPATFTVKSPTMIFANVPTGATSGYVTVTTANGTLKSNAPFRVLP